MSDSENKKPAEQWDTLLTDVSEANEEEQYIVPNIEFELPKHKRQECRDIVLEIKKFGVNQRQLLYLTYLLALELEDNATMRALTKAIGDNRKNIPLTKLEIARNELAVGTEGETSTPANNLIIVVPTK